MANALHLNEMCNSGGNEFVLQTLLIDVIAWITVHLKERIMDQ